MNEILTLLKKDFLKFVPFILNFKGFIKEKKNLKKFLMYIFIILVISVNFTFVFKLIESIHDGFKEQNKEIVFFSLISTGYAFMILMFVFPYSISTLYNSKDTESLLCLPIKGKSIMMSKILLLSSAFPFGIVFLVLPAMVKFAENLDNSIIYYVFNIVNLIAFGFIVTAILVLICIGMMRFINKFPRIRNSLQVIGLVLIFVIAVGLQMSIQSTNSQSSSEMTSGLLNTYESLGPLFEYFYPIKLLATGLTSNSAITIIQNSLINLIIAIVVLNLVTILGFKTWLKGLFSAKSSPNVKVNKKALSSSKTYKSRASIWSIAKKEFTCILKTPIYLFNIGMMSVLMIVAICIPVYIQVKNNNINLSQLNKIGETINNLPIDTLNLVSIAFGIGIALGAFLTMGGSSASSSITREGKNIWLMQVLPISPKTQVIGRIISSTIISISGTVPIIILVTVIINPPILTVIGLFIGMLLSSNFVGSYSLFIDILKPKLSWDNPQQAIKQNLNIVLTMVIDMLYIGGSIFAIFFLFEKKVIDFEQSYLLALIILIIHIIVEFIFYKLSVKLWTKKLTKYRI